MVYLVSGDKEWTPSEVGRQVTGLAWGRRSAGGEEQGDMSSTLNAHIVHPDLYLRV